MNVNSRSRRGYPLSALFLLVTACGVLLAVTAPVVRGVREVGINMVLGASVTGVVVGIVLGAVIGLYHYALLRGAGWGVVVGGVVGALVTPLVVVPAEDFPALLSAALGSAAVLLGVGALLRQTSEKEGSPSK